MLNNEYVILKKKLYEFIYSENVLFSQNQQHMPN